MKPDFEKLVQQAEDVREALGALSDGTKSLTLTKDQAERLLPFIHDTQEIATAFTARLQAVFLGVPPDTDTVTLGIDEVALEAGTLRCQYIDPLGKQCSRVAIGFAEDGKHIACKKHGGKKTAAAGNTPPQSDADQLKTDTETDS